MLFIREFKIFRETSVYNLLSRSTSIFPSKNNAPKIWFVLPLGVTEKADIPVRIYPFSESNCGWYKITLYCEPVISFGQNCAVSDPENRSRNKIIEYRIDDNLRGPFL
jgi:hypothetical protein